MTDYFVEIEHFLGADELALLRQDHLPYLLALNRRYTPHIDVESQFPVTPIYVDYLRTQWMLDSAPDRATTGDANLALGYAFGLLLERCTRLRWCIAKDPYGQFISLGSQGEGVQAVSVPPFSYVEKRETTQNAEVFLHFFEQIDPQTIGFVRPANWLLD